MEQQVAYSETNNDLYSETLQLYNDRHRKLTIGRLVRETGLSWNFVAGFKQRQPAATDKILKLKWHLERYVNNPHLI